MHAYLQPRVHHRLPEVRRVQRRGDLRRAIHESLAAGPVVPLGDGTWSPTAAAWPGYAGPLFLAADGGEWYTHMACTFRDSMNGPLYLVFQEVLEPEAGARYNPEPTAAVG